MEHNPALQGVKFDSLATLVDDDGDGGVHVVDNKALLAVDLPKLTKCTRCIPFNSTPMAVNSISLGSPHVRPVVRTCGEPDEIKKNTHPKNTTAFFFVG